MEKQTATLLDLQENAVNGEEEEEEEEEGVAENGEENPLVSESQPDESTTALLTPVHTYYIAHREWLEREAQVYFIPSAVPGKEVIDHNVAIIMVCILYVSFPSTS